MLNNYIGILMLNEEEDNIKSLTKARPLASIPIGGRYRIIDFVLSNMVNSGIYNVGIFTNTKFRSLADHLGSGKPWDLDRKINNGKQDYLNCNTLYINEDNSVLSIGKNIGAEDKLNISMEMFIMKKSTLITIIKKAIQLGNHNSIKAAIYNSTFELNVNAFEFKGYLQSIDSIKNYYKASMDMLDIKVTKELFFKNGLIYTKNKDEAATKYFKGSKVKNSLISNGCILKGHVENSVISRRVTVHSGAEINNCIIFQNCEIKSGCKLTNVIIDKNTIVNENTVLIGNEESLVVIEKKSQLE